MDMIWNAIDDIMWEASDSIPIRQITFTNKNGMV